MRVRLAIALGLGLAAACSESGTGPGSRGNEKSGGNTQGTASVTGIVFGFTTAPDSQRLEISGATVTLIRVADLLPPDTGTVDTLLPPPGPDTTLTNRSVAAFFADTVVPPDTTTLPPPAGCAEGTVAATVATGSDGAWQADGLEEGTYNVRVDPPAGSQFRAIEYCGYAVQHGPENHLDLYLPFRPGPDPLPTRRQPPPPF